MDLVIGLTRCRLEAHVRHVDILRRSYDVGLAATSYVLVATERTGGYKTGREQFFPFYVQDLCFWRVHEALAFASFFGISTSASQG